MSRGILIKANEVDATGCIFTEKCLKDLAEQSGGALVYDPEKKELRNHPDLMVYVCFEIDHEEISKREGQHVVLIHKFKVLEIDTEEI